MVVSFYSVVMYSYIWNYFFSSAFLQQLFCTAYICSVWHFTEAEVLNERPIIGVLAQESSGSLSKYGDSFIRTSYVNYLELAGARTVPIRINEDESYYVDMFSKINGVLFPGGNANIETSGYARAGTKLYEMAIKSTDNGDPFPIWATCLGFELLSRMTAGKDLLENCDANNVLLSLNFTSDYKTSRLYKNLPSDLYNIASTSAFTQNYHHFCLNPNTLQNNDKLNSFYHVSSTSVDKKGTTFISSMEAYNYQFYGVQFHPEKNVFDWNTDEHVIHSQDAIRFTQYLADLFVGDAKKSSHRFSGEDEEAKALFDNYSPVFFGAPTFHSVYFFDFPNSEINRNKETMVHKSDQHFYLAAGDFMLQVIRAFCVFAVIGCCVQFIITKTINQ